MEFSEQSKGGYSVDNHGTNSILSKELADSASERLEADTAPEKDDISSESDVEEAEEITDVPVRQRTQNSKFKDL